MAPHPVIMHVLWDDRNRQVLDGATRRRRGDSETQVCAEVSASAHRQPVADALARIALILAPPKPRSARAGGPNSR